LTRRYIFGPAGKVLTQDISNGNATAGPPETRVDSTHGSSPLPDDARTLLHRLLDVCSTVLTTASSADTSHNTADVNLQMAALKVFRAVVTSPVCGVHDTAMLLVLRTPFHVYLVTKSPAVKAQAKSSLLDMLRTVFLNLEAHYVLQRQQSKPAAPVDDLALKSEDQEKEMWGSQSHVDAYVLLRGLCRMSAKDLPVDENGEEVVASNTSASSIIDKNTFPRLYQAFNSGAAHDPLELESKILALELILASLDFGGDSFRSSDRFVHLIQSFLCVSLLKNCMSQHTQVAFLSQKIFLVLVSESLARTSLPS
jgi:brefeldin A-inhibited guanine nucleotide-exchange protein